MLSVQIDFRLAKFQFLSCNVALVYLVESIESDFCHCAAVKVRPFKIFFQPGLRLEMKCKQPRRKTRGFVKEVALSLDI